MNSPTRQRTTRRPRGWLAPLAVLAIVAGSLGTAEASVMTVLTEDFEAPDVASNAGDGFTTGQTPAGWVRSNQGFGATRHGITDKAGGDFSAPDPNFQAYAFRYTNSGLTSAVGEIGALDYFSTYKVSFDVVLDGGGTGATNTPYTAQPLAFDTGATRNDTRPSWNAANPNSPILATVSGNAPNDGSFATVTFEFDTYGLANPADFGKDVGLRFIGATNSAIIDNVSVTVVRTPTPAALPAGLALMGLVTLRRRRRHPA